MNIVKTVAEVRAAVSEARTRGQRVGFVPTMGFLHRGHVSLLEAARRASGFVALSIFVNPTQFGPNEDLDRYPRDLDGDLAHARAADVDLVFTPAASEIYPPGYQTFLTVRDLEKPLCGAGRPGHFTGVATVVNRLFNIVRPDVAFFGEKDFQQLQVIRRLVRDLELGVEIVGLPIVREPDGLALSSRNTYLSTAERASALALSRALFTARDRFTAGERNAQALTRVARAILDGEPGLRVDYLELRDAETLALVEGAIAKHAVLAVAAFAGRTRLIDNQQLAI